MRAITGGVLGLLAVAYPFLVYVSLDRWPTSWLLSVIAAIWLVRALLRPATTQLGGRYVPLIALVGCLILALMNTEASLRVYPVMMNALMLSIFGLSLVRGRPIIERLARLRHPDLPPEGIRYTRRVTQIWCAFFLLNGLIATMLGIWSSWEVWTWYNGAVSYVLMAILFAGEWLVRPRMDTAKRDICS